MTRRKRNVLSDLEFYDRVSGSGRFTGPIHMFRPLSSSQRNAGLEAGSPSQEAGSSASSPASAAAAKESPPSDKG
jgi:hypothetical protein